MSVRMRHTRAHTKNRRSHHALGEVAISNESKDGAHLRHRVSPITGKYKGEQIIEIKKGKKDVKDVKDVKETQEDKPTKEQKEENKRIAMEDKKVKKQNTTTNVVKKNQDK